MANPKSNINIGGQIVDASVETPERVWRAAWSYDGKAVSVDPVEKAVILTRIAKEECGKRIFAVADANTQMNIAAAAAMNRLSADDKATFDAALDWVDTMRAKVVVLVGGDDGAPKYVERVIKDDASWPAVPAGVQALADKY